MDQNTTARVVLQQTEQVVVSTEVNLLRYTKRHVDIYTTGIQLTAVQELVIITGIGLRWFKRDGLGQETPTDFFYPTFVQLKLGEQFTVTEAEYLEAMSAYPLLAPEAGGSRIADVLVRLLTPHGATVLDLRAQRGRQDERGEWSFRLDR